jgi:hypothetical protein
LRVTRKIGTDETISFLEVIGHFYYVLWTLVILQKMIYYRRDVIHK